ncbi:MAG: ATP-binding protein, partial [bacterium]|nr:ATP-binding protein [bacterium]
MIENTNKNWVITVSLNPPELSDNTADTDRLINALKKELKTDFIQIDLHILKKIPSLIRKNNFTLKCVLFQEFKRWILVDIIEPYQESIIAGLAVDLGTTRIVLELINLETGKTIGESSFDNPQIEIGPDILERIHFTSNYDGLEIINKLVIDSINSQVEKICENLNMKISDIFIMSIAGNTAMTHLFLGIDPSEIIREPYIPVINRPGLLLADEIGLKLNKRSRVFVFPNIGSYFGGDLIAGILFSGINKDEDVSILVDVGTNAEVVLGNSDWLMACAGAAGPALEGGVSKMGMMAGPGVIDSVAIDQNSREINITTIEDKKPKGICGSGLIDLAAQLFLSGMVDIRGRFVPEICKSRLFNSDGVNALILVPKEESATDKDLVITQIDMDSLIRSKAAMYTILDTISASVTTTFSELKTFYIAGTFGSFIKPESAISIGMIPDIPVEKYSSLGN